MVNMEHVALLSVKRIQGFEKKKIDILFRRFCNDNISYSVNRCSWKDFDFNQAVFIPIIVTDCSYRYPGSIFAAATCETKLNSRVKAARALICLSFPAMKASCGLVEQQGQLWCVAQMNLLGLLESPEFLVQIIFSYEL